MSILTSIYNVFLLIMIHLTIRWLKDIFPKSSSMKIQYIDYFHIYSINSCIFILINCICVFWETYNLAKRQLFQNLQRFDWGSLLMKGGVKGKRKRGGGQGTGYISKLLSWIWTVKTCKGRQRFHKPKN